MRLLELILVLGVDYGARFIFHSNCDSSITRFVAGLSQTGDFQTKIEKICNTFDINDNLSILNLPRIITH